MDRASDSGSEGWGFESLPVYHKKDHPKEDNVTKLAALVQEAMHQRMSASGNGCTFSVKWACQVSGSGNPLKKSIQNRKVMLLYR